MRVSYKWLQEYVDIPVSPSQLAERLTAAGLAVEGYEDLGAEIEKVYTGRILKITPHPNADRLVVCTVDVGGPENLQIVTGATNIRENDIVPVAVEGARLAGGVKIKKTKLRGVESRGMLCSGEELGLDPDGMPAGQAHGIMILPPDTPVGKDARPYAGLDDVILELELTPNRGDCLSMVGVAREVAAIFNTELKIPRPELKSLAESIEGKVTVDIEEPELCRRYVAKLLTNVKIFPSPGWMQERLRAAGVRPINNVVDVTNYVMMELGQPLHAFDFQKLKDGHIIVRRAGQGEKMVSLDGEERTLSSEMLVIADPAGPVAIAGVMGGLESEVTEETTMVLLESANFDPVSVRRTSKALGLRSESSLRFEKGVDVNGCLRAAERAAQLLQAMGACDVVAGEIDNYPRPLTEKTIAVRPSRVSHLLGKDIPAAECKDILFRLQFKVQEGAGEELLVTVPTFRPDISLEVDLIEEVARIHGYDRVPETLPTGKSTRGARTAKQSLIQKIRQVLTGCGLYEIITYSFHSREVFDRLGIPAGSHIRDAVALQNPLSEEQAVMRTLMLPGMLDVLQRNYNRRNYSGGVFGLGRVFCPKPGEGLPEEREKLAAAVMGKTKRAWNSPPREMDFYYAKGILETLFNMLGITGYTFEPAAAEYGYHPGRTAQVKIKGKDAGILGEIHPRVLENYELPERVAAFELDLEILLESAGKVGRYRPLPKFPGVDRDLAVVVPEDVLVRDVLRAIKKAGGELLRKVELFDVYKGKQVKEGYQSLAFSLKFQAEDRTLTDAEINELINTITSRLAKETGAELRG